MDQIIPGFRATLLIQRGGDILHPHLSSLFGCLAKSAKKYSLYLSLYHTHTQASQVSKHSYDGLGQKIHEKESMWRITKEAACWSFGVKCRGPGF